MIDSARVRSQFPSLTRVQNSIPLTYLDAPAGTQVPQQVIDGITNYYKNSNANTHGEFLTTHETDGIIAAMRKSVAGFLGAEGPETISIGQNMTTLNFALARGIARNLRPGDEVLITQLDHEGNRGPWLMLREFGVTVREVKLLSDGWTAVTKDRSLSAQFEHSIGVTETGYEIFTLSPKGWHKPPYA